MKKLPIMSVYYVRVTNHIFGNNIFNFENVIGVRYVTYENKNKSEEMMWPFGLNTQSGV